MSQRSRMVLKLQFTTFLLPPLGPLFQVTFCLPVTSIPIQSVLQNIHPSRAALETLPNALPIFNIVSHYLMRETKLLCRRTTKKKIMLCNLIPLKSEETAQKRH